jgi:hypothetical protein
MFEILPSQALLSFGRMVTSKANKIASEAIYRSQKAYQYSSFG